MKSLKESILDRDLVDDYKINGTEEDLKYTFSADMQIGLNEPGEVLLNQLCKPSNGISRIEGFNLLHQYVEDDKALRKFGFYNKYGQVTIKFSYNRDDKDFGGYDLHNIYFNQTSDNSKGYCVVFNPLAESNTSKTYGVLSNNIFLVCHVTRRHSKTLHSVEWVCDKQFEEKILRIIRVETRFQFTGSVEDSLKYIEKKYGHF